MSLLDCIIRIPNNFEKLMNNYNQLSESLSNYLEEKK